MNRKLLEWTMNRLLSQQPRLFHIVVSEAENIMMTLYAVPKICDLGLSASVQKSRTHLSISQNSNGGTVPYI